MANDMDAEAYLKLAAWAQESDSKGARYVGIEIDPAGDAGRRFHAFQHIDGPVGAERFESHGQGNSLAEASERVFHGPFEIYVDDPKTAQLFADERAREALREWLYAPVKEGRHQRHYGYLVQLQQVGNDLAEWHEMILKDRLEDGLQDGCMTIIRGDGTTYAAAVTSALAKWKEAQSETD